jgi:hypothetical protein
MPASWSKGRSPLCTRRFGAGAAGAVGRGFVLYRYARPVLEIWIRQQICDGVIEIPSSPVNPWFDGSCFMPCARVQRLQALQAATQQRSNAARCSLLAMLRCCDAALSFSLVVRCSVLAFPFFYSNTYSLHYVNFIDAVSSGETMNSRAGDRSRPARPEREERGAKAVRLAASLRD